MDQIGYPSALCIVEVYDAPGFTEDSASPTWGRHGGLLTVSATPSGTTADLAISRWSVSGTTLTRTVSTSNVGPITLPATFSPLVDAPFDSSFIAWTGASESEGGAFTTSDTAMQKAFTGAGITSFAFGPPDSLGDVRLFYTGFSPLDGPSANAPSLYAADFHADGTPIGASMPLATWGIKPGRVTVDRAGHVIALQPTHPNGGYELRGFKAEDVKPGAPAVPGKKMIDLANVPDVLVAIAPSGSEPGLALVQEGINDSWLAIAVTYKVDVLLASDGAEGGINAGAADERPLLTVDPAGRLWVGIRSLEGPGRVFFVLDRH